MFTPASEMPNTSRRTTASSGSSTGVTSTDATSAPQQLDIGSPNETSPQFWHSYTARPVLVPPDGVVHRGERRPFGEFAVSGYPIGVASVLRAPASVTEFEHHWKAERYGPNVAAGIAVAVRYLRVPGQR